MPQAEEELENVTLEAEEVSEESTDETKTEGEEAEGEQEDEIVVSIGEEPPPTEEKTPAPEWVRELRKSDREKARKIKELEAKLQSVTVADKPAELGKKPALDDFDYNTEKYEQELATWYERKREHDANLAKQEAAAVESQKAWEAKLETYGKAKADLKAKDFDEAEALIQDSFSQTQQGIVLQGADNPALLVLALGRNPKKAKELSGITDPVKFAFAIAKLETQLKVTNRKAPPAPERPVSGTARVSGAVDSNLERLREEAARTGDMSKVIAYKRQKERQA